MDPLTCCLLGICCPPDSVEQENALIDFLHRQGVTDPDTAAKAILRHFALAPKSLGPVIAEIATLAKSKRP